MRNFVDFEPKIVRIHAKTAKIDRSVGIVLPGIVPNVIQDGEIPENS